VLVLIIGAGIAGPTLAYWLLCAGHQPTLVERAAELRPGGYLLGPEEMVWLLIGRMGSVGVRLLWLPNVAG
jgi:2-polyprenyl-6-methoxyphenol hydroxylase-like FAD-dependent oxidoreductase